MNDDPDQLKVLIKINEVNNLSLIINKNERFRQVPKSFRISQGRWKI